MFDGNVLINTMKVNLYNRQTRKLLEFRDEIYSKIVLQDGRIASFSYKQHIQIYDREGHFLKRISLNMPHLQTLNSHFLFCKYKPGELLIYERIEQGAKLSTYDIETEENLEYMKHLKKNMQEICVIGDTTVLLTRKQATLFRNRQVVCTVVFEKEYRWLTANLGVCKIGFRTNSK
jgi:hypothetical protein